MSTDLCEIDESPVLFPQRNGDQMHLYATSFCGPEIMVDSRRKCINLILRETNGSEPSRADRPINQIRLTESQAKELCRAIINAYSPDVKRGLADANI